MLNGDPKPSGDGLTAVIGRNIRAVAASQVVGKAAGFAAMVILARFLGTVDFGRYTVAVAFVSILAVLGEFGTGGFLVREGAQRPNDLSYVLGQAVTVRLVLGLVTVAAAFPAGLALGYDSVTLAAVMLFALASTLRLVGGAFLFALQALEHLGDMASAQARFAVVQAVAMSVTVVGGGDLVTVSAVLLGVSAVFPIWTRTLLRRRWQGRIAIRPRDFWRTMGTTAPFAVSAALFTMLTYLDAIMVQAFLGNTQTGLYGAGYRLLLALALVPTIYNESVTRAVARLASIDQRRMSALHSTAFFHLVLFSLPIAVGGAVVAGPLLGALFGQPYRGGATALAILLVSLIFAFPGWVNVTAAYALRLERRVAAAIALVVVFNAAINLFAIPRWGIEGAAATTLASEVLFMALALGILNRAGVRPPLTASVTKPFVAAAMMLGAVIPLRDLPLPIPVIAGALTYVGGLVVLRAFRREDIELVSTIIGRRPSRPAYRTDGASGPERSPSLDDAGEGAT